MHQLPTCIHLFQRDLCLQKLYIIDIINILKIYGHLPWVFWGYEWSHSPIPPPSIYFPVRIPGQYLHILASIISLICTLIAPTVFKCERPYQGMRSGGGYEEGDS